MLASHSPTEDGPEIITAAGGGILVALGGRGWGGR